MVGGETDTWLGPFGMNTAEAVISPAVITRRRKTGNSEDIIGKLNETMDGKFEMRVVGSWIYIAQHAAFFLPCLRRK